MSRHVHLRWAALILIGCLALTSCEEQAVRPGPGNSYKDWLREQGILMKDTSLVRHHTFEGIEEGAAEAPDLVGKEGALTFAVQARPAEAQEKMHLTEGRWPGKKAVHLDKGFLAGAPFAVANKSFTVAAWLRTNGIGAIRGDAVPLGGTLLSAGSGYWDGWRLTLSYPDRTIGFEIGQPKPSHSVGIRTAPVSDGVWHHLAATWDGREMRVYVDGLPAASAPYMGDYTPPPAGGKFRVGYAGSGWGSVLLDVDEVSVYSRALSAMEVLRSAHLDAPMPDAAAARFQSAQAAVEHKDLASAVQDYQAILNMKDVNAEYLATARLCMAQLLSKQNDPSAAVLEFAKMLEAPGLSDRRRQAALEAILQLVRKAGAAPGPKVLNEILAAPNLSPADRALVRLALARAFREEANPRAAREQYESILSDVETAPRQRLDIRVEIGHTCLEAKDFAAARQEYARILDVSDAPAQYKSLAQICIAETYAREKNYAAAKAEYAKVAAVPGVPAHLKWEAEERMRELARLQAGLPARDPAWSRVQLPKPSAPGLELFVAPDGADTNPGTRERPFATLERARDAIRDLKRRGGLPKGGVAVNVRGGEYPRKETFTLAAEDSGTPEAPILYCACKGETPRFTGGVPVTGFKPVQDPAILERLPEESRGKVVQLDLKAQGVTDFGELRVRGYGMSVPVPLELYFDGKPMTLARWPNEGFVRVVKVLDLGAKSPLRGATFEYDGDRPARWVKARDAWLFGYWRWYWCDKRLDIAAVDPKLRQIRTGHPYDYGDGMKAGATWLAFNLLEEMDVPGEWYLDRATGILYLYPPSDPALAKAEVTMLSVPMVEMDEVSRVTLQGLTFDLSRAGGIVIKGGGLCLVSGCVLSRLGGDGVIIDGGAAHGVFGCDIHTLGRGGTRVKGGDRSKLTPGRHFVENCHIYDFSRVDRTYTPAVHLDGVGNRIAHNVFHGSPGHAMRIEGNDHVIEFNEIYNVVTESDDQGGLDIYGNPSYRGNVFRYNYWHDIGGNDEFGFSQAGIRLDDAISGVLIYGNVFCRCSHGGFGGVQIHGGKENIVDNNVFVDCKYGISFSPWGKERWAKFLASEPVVKHTTVTVDIGKPPYSARYPALARLAEDPDVNMVWRNLVYNCGEFLTRDRGNEDLMDNYITSRDPGFVDAAKRDFRLRPDAPALSRLGLRPIPFEEIGCYK